MSKSYKITLAVLIGLLAFFVYMEASSPTPVNWQPSYSVKDKIPLGTYVFFNSLKAKAGQLEKVKESPYEFLQDSTVSGTYMFINHALSFDKPLIEEFLHWVKQGNTLFVSAYYSTLFDADTLHLEWGNKLRLKSLVNYSKYNLVNPTLKADSAYVYKHNAKLGFFKEIDTLHHRVLGLAYLHRDSLKTDQKEVNFIAIPYGKGKILLQTAPEAFSNFFMLTKHNYAYAEKAMAYLNLKGKVYYDVSHDRAFTTYYTSPLYVFLGNKYLKWGYYFILIGAILFIIFEGKRKQKAIKVIPPLRNKTYDYTRTIAGMYLKEKDHTAIAHKKIDQFLAYIRNELRTDVQTVDDELITHLHQLTHNSKTEIRQLFKDIQYLQNQDHITKEELLLLNEKINHFKVNT